LSLIQLELVIFLIADFMIGDVKLEESENIQEAGQILAHEAKVNYEPLS